MPHSEENVSSKFGVEGIDIEQTILEPFDPFRGLDINTSIFKNTEQGFKNSNNDGRVPLGCFVLDNDNTLSDDFPSLFRDEKFEQIPKKNLIINGSGKGISSPYTKQQYITNESSNYDVRPYIPHGKWGYCTYDSPIESLKKRDMGLYFPDSNLPEGSFELSPEGKVFIQSFEQSSNYNIRYEERSYDYHHTTGSSGFFAYFFDTNGSAARPQVHLDMISKGYKDILQTDDRPGRLGEGRNYENNTKTGSYTQPGDDSSEEFYNQTDCDEFFHRNNLDSHTSLGDFDGYDMIPTIATPSGWTSNPPSKVILPNIAKWIETTEAYSFNRCLEFLATDLTNTEYYFTGQKTSGGNFSWDDNLDGVNHNQYRILNQVATVDTNAISQHAIIEVNFKMKTDSRFYNGGTLPQVECALVSGDGDVGDATRTYDRINATNQYGYYNSHGYWPKGEFNSQRYNDDLNSPNTVNRKFSNFGSMGRFQNTTTDTWETFTYRFSLGRWYHYWTSRRVRNIQFIIQAAGKFLGRVLIDDIEVIESYDFVPDVDVRKKISVGNYGKADLTKYYDKELQPEEYKDSQAPLEAQFYFYPTYKLDSVFNKRTPMYKDFKNGLFYLYDVDWGDGSPREFTDEPKQINLEKAIYHLYKKSGIFEITGTMIRLKPDNHFEEKPVGIGKHKKFRLRINVNEGTAEDFEFFGSDGFSFIPYKNTLPIVGGVSQQSTYYKTIKRQLGFVSLGANINIDNEFQTSVPFKYEGDRLKTQIAFDRMDSSLTETFNLLNEYKIPRQLNGNTIYNGISTNSNEIGKGVGDLNITCIKFYNQPKSMYELLGFDSEDAGTPTNPRYWKKIIPQGYSIFNREGIDNQTKPIINIFSEQDWLGDYYYPVLPKYDSEGNFREDTSENIYPNNKIPFPLDGPITNTLETSQNLLINITSDKVENNVFSDNSGNQNLGFAISDYNPKFDVETLSPMKTKLSKLIKTATNNGAF
jgi:hypothetical protein